MEFMKMICKQERTNVVECLEKYSIFAVFTPALYEVDDVSAVQSSWAT
jgi:hypothetical protein